MYVDILRWLTLQLFVMDPETLVFDQKQLIEHYIQVAYEGKPVSMFPYKLKKVYNTTNMYLTYKLPSKAIGSIANQGGYNFIEITCIYQ